MARPDARKLLGDAYAATRQDVASLDAVLPGMRRRVAAIAVARKHARLIVACGVALYAFVAIKDAWLSDDAYITFRTVDNFVHGYGLTWNVDERVQSFTHPLWALLLSAAYFVVRNIYFTSLALSLVLSVAAVCILSFGIARSPLMGLLGSVLLAASKSFVDFSTSGLEDPLSFFLLAAFALVYFRYEAHRRYVLALGLLVGLATLNRMDLLLLFAPALVFVMRKRPSMRTLQDLALGFVPFALWECFSLWYYGFLFPNTAYAKLNTGTPEAQLLVHGIWYLMGSVQFDPILAIGLGLGLVTPFLLKEQRLIALAEGIVLYVLYVIYVGGDFMAGRFLAPPLLLAVVLVVRNPFPTLRSPWTLGLVAACVLGIITPHSRWLTNYASMSAIDTATGVADERAYYASATALVNVWPGTTAPDHQWARDGLQARLSNTRVVVTHSVGFFGFMAGPHVHIVDMYALCDPLLARMPALPGSRIGHFTRDLPEGYVETLEGGRNVIQDPHLALYYSKLQVVTRGNLFDLHRLIEIWKLNIGAYDGMLRAYNAAHPPQPGGPSGRVPWHPGVATLSGLCRPPESTWRGTLWGCPADRPARILISA